MAGIVPLPLGAAAAGAEGIDSHPLLNPVVLKRLFELIPFELQDFRSFRLVSRAWHDESLSTWRQNAWLTLVESEPEIPEISLQQYLELIENDEHQLGTHPFRKYLIHMWNINIQFENQDQDQHRFWNRVGPLMRHLIVQKSKFFTAADVRAIIFEKTPHLQRLSLVQNLYQSRTKRPDNKKKRMDPKLPQHALIPTERVQRNLIELDIDLVVRPEEGEAAGANMPVIQIKLPMTWMELLIHFPNIKKLGPLQLSVGLDAEAELLEFLESVEVLRKKHGPRYLAGLQDLDLMQVAVLAPSARSGVFVSCLNRLHLPLKRLALAFGPSVDEKIFKKLLHGCVNTLEHLTLAREAGDGGEEGPRPFVNFPFGLKLLALKELTLRGPLAPNLMFLKECPNLELLRFTTIYAGQLESDLTQLLEGSDGIPPTLEKMKDFWINNDGCSAEEVRKLGLLMPNMRKLKMGLDNGSFRALCVVWNQLEHLTIVPWRIEENALLGKDVESGEKFRHPNLTDLRYLKRFEMGEIRNGQRLTNAAILEGIMALPNLVFVNLCISSEVTSHLRHQLGRKFPKCHISTQERGRGGNEGAAVAAQLQRNLRLGNFNV